MLDAGEEILVLGIGNLLWADEGFGVRAVEALQRDWEFEGPIRLMDGGTQGLYLVNHVQEADRLIILDAVDYGLPAGTLKVAQNDDVPRYLGAKKMSLHQTGFQEVLMLAQLTGRFPREVVLIGVQPERLDDYGGSLTPLIKARIPPAVALALECLRAWGVTAIPRREAPGEREAVTTAVLDMARYESGRPSPQAACRHGDGRVLPGAQGVH